VENFMENLPGMPVFYELLYTYKGKGKFVPVHVMKTSRGKRGKTPLSLNLGIR
jgi:hypothetical protein